MVDNILAETLTEALKWRYATKKFDSDKPLSREKLDMILNAARMAPTSYGLQPFRITVITDQKLKDKIHEGANVQAQVIDAPALVVFSIPDKLKAEHIDEYMQLMADTRNVDVSTLSGFSNTIKTTILSKSAKEQQTWAAKQAYLALGFLLQASALNEVDACPMEGFNAEKLHAVLPESEGYQPVVMVALGHRSDADKVAYMAKVRKDKKDIIRFI